MLGCPVEELVSCLCGVRCGRYKTMVSVWGGGHGERKKEGWTYGCGEV